MPLALTAIKYGDQKFSANILIFIMALEVYSIHRLLLQPLLFVVHHFINDFVKGLCKKWRSKHLPFDRHFYYL